MKRTIIVAALIAAVAAIGLSAQSGSGGMHYVMKMELQETPGQTQPNNQMAAMAVSMFKQMVLPEGAVVMDMLTDGQSLRTEMGNQMATLPKGSVIIYAAGQNDGYVINNADKTYYLLKTPQAPALPGGMTLPKPEISIKPTGTFETVVGHKAEKVNINWRMPLPVPEGVDLPPGVPTELTMTFENLCATDLKIPTAAQKLMSGATSQGMAGMGFEEMSKACSFPLVQRMTMSMMPGIAIVSTVTTVEPAAPAADVFKLPAGYKEVQPPTPKIPGGPGGTEH